MNNEQPRLIGYACAYTPVALIAAAGFTPYRILPNLDLPELAGQYLHDNLCPHVKRILDRAASNELPALAGVVFVNSCDTMRRLSDAWRRVRPADRTILVDLPIDAAERSASYFAGELSRLAETLGKWRGRDIADEDIRESLQTYRALAELLAQVEKRRVSGHMSGGRARMQTLYNRAMTEPVRQMIGELRDLTRSPDHADSRAAGTPVFLFGNVLADPEALELFESCGANIVADDLCTGSRMFPPFEIAEGNDLLAGYARTLLSRAPCARTMAAGNPGGYARHIVETTEASGARGVIGHVVKFCDPYLARIPAIREALQAAKLPLLVLEGDCTLRSFGQHQTRIEAFVEMLG